MDTTNIFRSKVVVEFEEESEDEFGEEFWEEHGEALGEEFMNQHRKKPGKKTEKMRCEVIGAPSGGGDFCHTGMDLTPFYFPRNLLKPDAKVNDIYRANDEVGRGLTVWHLAKHVLDKNMLSDVIRVFET
jgi:hypothetical protein